MRPRAITVRVVIAALFLAGATAAHATLYRWVDETGGVTYSNLPPPEPNRVRDLVTIPEERPPTTIESRTREILEEAERERRASEGRLKPQGSESARWENPRRESELSRIEPSSPDAAIRDSGVSGHETDSVTRRAPRAAPTEAVQDPCLRSADRNCYQRNAGKYHPYLGYSPSRVESATGATSAGAGGSIASTVALPSPPRRPSAFPPGTTVAPIPKHR